MELSINSIKEDTYENKANYEGSEIKKKYVSFIEEKFLNVFTEQLESYNL